MAINEEYKEALREFFQHERDEELGRWRWPENPDYVVYVKCESESEPLAGVRVLHERTGRSRDIGRAVVNACEATVSGFGRAAREYFEAHPERKPWHEAKPWETWVFTIDGKEQSATLDEDREFRDRSFHTCSWMHVKDDRISAGRRIWPESD